MESGIDQHQIELGYQTIELNPAEEAPNFEHGHTGSNPRPPKRSGICYLPCASPRLFVSVKDCGCYARLLSQLHTRFSIRPFMAAPEYYDTESYLFTPMRGCVYDRRCAESSYKEDSSLVGRRQPPYPYPLLGGSPHSTYDNLRP